MLANAASTYKFQKATLAYKVASFTLELYTVLHGCPLRYTTKKKKKKQIKVRSSPAKLIINEKYRVLFSEFMSSILEEEG